MLRKRKRNCKAQFLGDRNREDSKSSEPDTRGKRKNKSDLIYALREQGTPAGMQRGSPTGMPSMQVARAEVQDFDLAGSENDQTSVSKTIHFCALPQAIL